MTLCNAAHAAGCHWGTFQLTDELIDEPARKLTEALDDQGIGSTEPQRCNRVFMWLKYLPVCEALSCSNGLSFS